MKQIATRSPPKHEERERESRGWEDNRRALLQYILTREQ